jgi:drug/metabolite transporter (DMT)-like permease
MIARSMWLMDRPVRIHVLGGLLTLTTVAALAGGALLLADPSGSLLGLTVADLGAAPFPNYLIPGAVLLALFGVLPIPVLIGLWRKRNWASHVAGMLGVALATWITAQVLWFGSVNRIQALVWAMALILTAVAGVPRWRRDLT